MISINKNQLRDNLEGYAFIAPALFGLVAFLLYPIVSSVYISFLDWNLLTDPKWAGLANYGKLVKDEVFIASLLNTFKWVIFYVPISIVLSFILSLAAELPLRGISVFRTLFYLPVISPLLVVAMIFVWLYNPEFGAINYLLSKVGIPAVPWLTEANIAIFSIAIMSTWKMAGYNMVIFLAGLNGIPRSLYDAADIDGVTPLQKIWHIKLPLITPAIYYVTIMAVINAFQVFGEIIIMTKGGPGYSTYTLVYYLYNNAFKYNSMGYASAISCVMTVIILAVTIFQSFILGKRVQYDFS